MKNNEFVIDRRTWSRQTEGNQFFNNDDALALYFVDKQTNKVGKCCLGFALMACNFQTKQLDGLSMPNEVELTKLGVSLRLKNPIFKALIERTPNWSEEELKNTKLARELANINDNIVLTDAEKESQIISKFKEAGIQVSFKN